jgi:hypothetical protein
MTVPYEVEDTCSLYNITTEEYKTILALRSGEAQIVLVPKNRQNKVDVRIGDIDQYDCRIVDYLGENDFLISSQLEPEEVDAALAAGAKRVII